jgi:hypothetical protein
MKAVIPEQRFLGFSPEEFRRFIALSDERRYAVLERAALIVDGTGCTWAEGDARALAEESLRMKGGR